MVGDRTMRPCCCYRPAARRGRAGDDLRLWVAVEPQVNPVLLARRGTDKYGGLNLRFASVEAQQITTRLDPSNAAARKV
jgi:hypothetical protein